MFMDVFFFSSSFLFYKKCLWVYCCFFDHIYGCPAFYTWWMSYFLTLHCPLFCFLFFVFFSFFSKSSCVSWGDNYVDKKCLWVSCFLFPPVFFWVSYFLSSSFFSWVSCFLFFMGVLFSSLSCFLKIFMGVLFSMSCFLFFGCPIFFPFFSFFSLFFPFFF